MGKIPNKKMDYHIGILNPKTETIVCKIYFKVFADMQTFIYALQRNKNWSYAKNHIFQEHYDNFTRFNFKVMSTWKLAVHKRTGYELYAVGRRKK